MALPSSGQISFGDINVEAGLTRNTANTKLAGSSTPTGGSLIGLYANSGVNQTAPHKVSEFRGITYGIQLYAYATVIDANTFDIEVTVTDSCSTKTPYTVPVGYNVKVTQITWEDDFGQGTYTSYVYIYGGSSTSGVFPLIGPTSNLHWARVDFVQWDTTTPSGYISTIYGCP